MIFGTLSFLAQGTAQRPVAAANPLGMLVPMILVFVVFYFLIIGPQRKKQKKHLEEVRNLTAGKQIITAGGIVGTVVGFKKDDRLGDLIEVKIASNTNITITKGAVGTIVDTSDKVSTR